MKNQLKILAIVGILLILVFFGYLLKMYLDEPVPLIGEITDDFRIRTVMIDGKTTFLDSSDCNDTVQDFLSKYYIKRTLIPSFFGIKIKTSKVFISCVYDRERQYRNIGIIKDNTVRVHSNTQGQYFYLEVIDAETFEKKLMEILEPYL